MASITYSELIDRYGSELAHDLLITIEKSAKIRDSIIHIDENTRLQRALDALNPELEVA